MNPWTAILIPAAMAGAVALAQPAPGPMSPPQAADMPDFLNGGIGHDDAQRLRAAARQYPLEIEFSESRANEFLADAALKVTDARGRTVFERNDVGPILLLRLAPGTYRLTATADGRPETRMATITPKHTQHLYFHWQGLAQAEPDAPTPVAQAGLALH